VQKKDGMNYAPQGKVNPVCKPGEFRFAAVGLDHGHIYGMCNGLIEAGGELAWVFDSDPQRIAAFCAAYGGVRIARSEAEVLEDPAVRLVASATVPCRRGPLGRGARRTAGRQQVNGLEQIGLALAVRALDHRQPARQAQLQAGVVAEVGEGEVVEAHGEGVHLS
jgi:hypothetical protein